MPNQHLIIEKANWERFPAVLKLLDNYLPKIYTDSYKEWRKKLEDDFKKGRKVCIAALYNNELVGVIIYQQLSAYVSQERTLELKTILADKNYRRSPLHVGSNLLAAFHYELQRTGYTRVVAEAKFDQFVVPWLISKGYKVAYHHSDYGWLSYRLEKELPRMYVDDRNDSNLVLRWVVDVLGIKNLKPIEGIVPLFEGTMYLGSELVSSEVRARIKYCSDMAVLESCIKHDQSSSHIPFYLVNSPTSVIPKEIRDQVTKANGVIIGTDELTKLLGGQETPFSCSRAEKQCLAVLVYPEHFKRLVSRFTGKRFAYVGSGWYGALLSEESRVIFASSSDYRVLGAADYLKHQQTDGLEATWDSCGDLVIFDKEEFQRWVNIKRHMTILECDNLKTISPGAPLTIPGPQLPKDKWTYYPYEKFMEYIKGYLS